MDPEEAQSMLVVSQRASHNGDNGKSQLGNFLRIANAEAPHETPYWRRKFFVHTVLSSFVENLSCSDRFVCQRHAVELQAFILWILQFFRED